MNVVATDKMQSLIHLPASKSISNRALVIGALCEDEVELENVSGCDDSAVVAAALCEMPEVIDIKSAGTAMRFLTSFLATRCGEFVLTGSERMCNRPISVLVDALRSLGADISYVGTEGYPPLKIKGSRLEGGRLALSGNVSSQYISSLLMIGPTLRKGLSLQLEGNIVSRPYIDMTMSIMRQFGAQVRWSSANEIVVASGGYSPAAYSIENDWSAASYWYEMVALSSDENARITLPSLFADSMQGDSVVADLFLPLGVKSVYGDNVVIIEKSGSRVSYYEHDMMACPDLAQTIVVACCMLGVPFRLSGLQTLRIKETDRIAALQCELRKLGFVVDVHEDDAISWDGTQTDAPEPGAVPAIDTYDDHRMAMAFAPVALCRGSIEINNPEVVSKSYPSFWQDLQKAGFILN
jgi:3-phosphoshikimate 1-carboxyvinyltransferase